MNVISFIRKLTNHRKQWLADTRQHAHVLRCVDASLERAVHSQSRAGSALYCMVPDEIATILNTAWFDPYGHHMNRIELTAWLQKHIVFDANGEMVVLHNEGEVLWEKPGNTLVPRIYAKENNNG